MLPRNHRDRIRIALGHHQPVLMLGCSFRTHWPSIWSCPNCSNSTSTWSCPWPAAITSTTPTSCLPAGRPAIPAAVLKAQSTTRTLPAQLPANRLPFTRSASDNGRAGCRVQRQQSVGHRRANSQCFRRPLHYCPTWCPIRRRRRRAPCPRPSRRSSPVRPYPIQHWGRRP